MPPRNERDYYPVDWTLNGKLIYRDDVSLANANDFQTLINMRPIPNGKRGIQGMDNINTNLPATYVNYKNGIHFRKGQPAESHILIQAFNAAETASRILDNTSTTIPTQNDFSATAVYAEAANSVYGYFSQAPDGHAAYANSATSLVWGGNESRIGGFLISDATNYINRTEQVNNTINATGYLATINQKWLYVGAIRPLQGFKFYIGTANTHAHLISDIHYWDGDSWESVGAGSIVDNTVTGTTTMTKTGTITFPSTVTTAKLREINGIFLYWYQIELADLIDATTTIYYVTVDAPMQQVTDIWNGQTMACADFEKYKSSKYSDYTTNISEDNYDSTNAGTYADLSSLSNTAGGDYIIAGFTQKQMGFIARIVDAKDNGTAGTPQVYYWSGIAWVEITGVQDSTADPAGTVFGKSGLITFTPTAEGIESKYKITSENEYYYYKIAFTGGLDGACWLKYFAGIPAPITIKNYKFPLFFQNRLLWCSDQNGQKNRVKVGQVNSVCNYSGADTIDIYVGDDRELTAGCVLFSRFGGAIYENAIVCKDDETHILDGDGIETYKARRVSASFGCVAPRTMQACDIGVTIQSENVSRNIAIWQAASAICMFDGNTVKTISDDIDGYFNTATATASKINTSMLNKSTAFYDEIRQEYHWCFATGSNTTLNKELIYNIKQNQWYEASRGTGKALQGGIQVVDAYGNGYNYGWDTAGYLQRLEYGTTFDGNDIVYTMQSCDKPLANSIMYKTEIDVLKIVTVAKNTTSATLAVTHYGDGLTTALTPAITAFLTSNASGRLSSTEIKIESPEAVFHSLKLSITTNNETIGFEPLYIGLFVKRTKADLAG